MSDLQINKRKGITFGRIVAASDANKVLESPFPSMRVIRWLPRDKGFENEYTDEAVESYAIVVTQEVLLATNRHVSETLERELGGFLLGNRYRCPNTGMNYVMIDQYIEANYTEGSAVSLSYTHESWAQVTELLQGKYYGKQLIGWYHSHPRMNVFLSNHDIAIHEERFADPWKTALVIEPEKHLGGFFAWRDSRLDPNSCVEFYELIEGQSRESVVAWSNYEGVDAKTNTPPIVSIINTSTPFTSSTSGLAAASTSTESGITGSAHSSAAESKLKSTPVLIALAALGLIFFVGTFAVVTLWKSKSDANTTATNQPETVEVQISDALKNVTVRRSGQPKLDEGANSLVVTLKVSEIPEDKFQEIKNQTKVLIEGNEAKTHFTDIGNTSFKIDAAVDLKNASNELKEKVENLREQRKEQKFEISTLISYDETDTNYPLALTVGPPDKNSGELETKKEEAGKSKTIAKAAKKTGNAKTAKTPQPVAKQTPQGNGENQDGSQEGQQQETRPREVENDTSSAPPTITAGPDTEAAKRASQQAEEDAKNAEQSRKSAEQAAKEAKKAAEKNKKSADLKKMADVAQKELEKATTAAKAAKDQAEKAKKASEKVQSASKKIKSKLKKQK